MSIQKVRDLRSKAHEVQHGITKLYVEFRDKYRTEEAKIRTSDKYTAKGKEELIDRLKRRKTAELMQLSRSQHQLHDQYIAEASKLAEELAYQKAPKADAAKKERFDTAFHDIKTELMLTSNSERAKEKMKSFIEGLDEYEFFEAVKNDFRTLSKSIIEKASGQEQGKLREEMRRLFEDVKTKSKTDEAREAEVLVAQTENDVGSGLFKNIAIDAIRSDLGVEAADYANKPESYFKEYPDAEQIKPDEKTVDDVVAEAGAESRVVTLPIVTAKVSSSSPRTIR